MTGLSLDPLSVVARPRLELEAPPLPLLHVDEQSNLPRLLLSLPDELELVESLQSDNHCRLSCRRRLGRRRRLRRRRRLSVSAAAAITSAAVAGGTTAHGAVTSMEEAGEFSPTA